MPNVKVLGPTKEWIVMDAGALAAEFESVFWPIYPRRIGKADALKAYQAARRLARATDIAAGVERYVQHKPRWQEWKHPGPWLRASRWLDEYDTARTPVTQDKPDWWEEAMAAAEARQRHALGGQK